MIQRTIRIECAIVAACAAAMLLAASAGRQTASDTYIRLADSVLHGHLWIETGPVIDTAVWNGQHYVVDGPFPTFAALPLVAMFGSHANQTLIAIAGGIIAVVLCWRLLLRLGVARVPRLWLTAFLFVGTDLCWCSELGDVWFLAHVAAVCMTLGALLEAFGKKRGWVIGLCAACACESRFPMVLALPLYAYLLCSERRWPALRGYALAIAAGVAFWVGMNEARWGLTYDIGHAIFYNQDIAYGAAIGSPFALQYLPYELYAFFLRAPTLLVSGNGRISIWPYIGLDQNGVALTFTSPALVLALLARTPRSVVVAFWATAMLVAVPSVLYYTCGWTQFGMRHALDFEPFLLVLMALAVRDRMPIWGAVLCAWSILFGAWGVWFWDMAYRAGGT